MRETNKSSAERESVTVEFEEMPDELLDDVVGGFAIALVRGGKLGGIGRILA